jgi:hypothetical protein
LGVRDDAGDVLHPSSSEVERVGYDRPEFLEIADSVFFISLLQQSKSSVGCVGLALSSFAGLVRFGENPPGDDGVRDRCDDRG